LYLPAGRTTQRTDVYHQCNDPAPEDRYYLNFQTVVIEDDIISKIAPVDKIKIPAGATVIDGTGKFLIPGLVDAHIHFSQSGGLYTRPDAIDLRSVWPFQKEIDWVHAHMDETLRRYVQNGITAVIDVGTTNNFLKRRADFATSPNAPSIYMSGPLLTTYEPAAFANLGDDGAFSLVTSVEDGQKGVQEQMMYNPDFIKAWYIVGRDTADIEASARGYLPIIKAITDEAHARKTPMAVHATQRITAQLAVENGCDYLVHSIDDEVVSQDFVQLVKKNKTNLCPTLIVHDGYVKTFGQNLQLSSHELRMGDPFQIGSLLDLKHLADTALTNRYKSRLTTPERQEVARTHHQNMLTNLKKFSDSGVIIATGTDAGNIGTLHASSYLAEVKAMQQSGMTNWQILQASTINGARVLGREREFGTVTKGKKANLVLLDADPVADIENITRIYRVINKGVIIDPDTLIAESPEAVVQRQLNAYNFHNLEAFLEPYADDVSLYMSPDKLVAKGKEEMRKAYAPLFEKNPDLHCELLERTIKGDVIIDEERVTYGTNVAVATLMYQVENGKIRKVVFMQ
jgi:imidazolonepropionase-like amidohydrolase